MEQAHDNPETASATAAMVEETKDYSTVGSTLHHLEATGQVSAPEDRPDISEQIQIEQIQESQNTVLDRRKEAYAQGSLKAGDDADNGKTLPWVFTVISLFSWS